MGQKIVFVLTNWSAEDEQGAAEEEGGEGLSHFS